MKHTWKVTIILLAVFISAQVIGLFIVANYIDFEQTGLTGVTSFEGLPLIERPQVEESVSYIYIMIAIIIGTLLLLLLIKFRSIGLWKLWFFASVSLTLTFAIAAFLPHMVSIALALALAVWKIYRPNMYIHNLTELLIYGGLAAIFVPIINIFSGIMLLLIISLYDMYAVWRSKHMVQMAKFQTESRLFAGLYIPYNRKDGKIEKIPLESSRSSDAEGVTKIVKSASTAILGGGDIGFPLIFAGVVMKTLMNSGDALHLAFSKSLIVVALSSLALLILLYKSQKEKFYPAMPFLSIGCVVGYGIVLLL